MSPTTFHNIAPPSPDRNDLVGLTKQINPLYQAQPTTNPKTETHAHNPLCVLEGIHPTVANFGAVSHPENLHVSTKLEPDV